jgi:PadR family transcriptional regulator, regulatory protein AphA
MRKSCCETGNAIRMSPISYVVLGLIGLRGPSTPYELKRAVDRSINYFWPFPHSQLYSEPERLAAAGLLSQELEVGGRHRKIYSLADEGRRILEAWLRAWPGEIFEMRDMAVMQLFFSEFMSTEDLVSLAKDQVRLYQERLEVYKTIADDRGAFPGRERRMAPLNLGVRLVQASIDFWADIAENPPPAPPARTLSSTPPSTPGSATE